MKKTHKSLSAAVAALMFVSAAAAQTDHNSNSTSSPAAALPDGTAATPPDTLSADSLEPYGEQELATVVVTRRKAGMVRMKGAVNGTLISRDELFKAACCNLGESFVTNPSVDVNYSDAATGAKQIKLLGLSGTYVQMLAENLPDFRGAATPYALGYVPGPWMKSIQVSKGSASVKNGYESMTGQINVDYLKPDDEPGAAINVYGNTESRLEANADANLHVAEGMSTELLAHYENQWNHHDTNHDGVHDMPNVRQYNVQNRWKAVSGRYMFHGGLSLLDERRTSGQLAHVATGQSAPLFTIGIKTDRYGAYMKHAVSLDRDHNTSVALMGNASLHRQEADYGLKAYRVDEKNLYAQLLFETDFTPHHNLAVGASLNHDFFKQRYRMAHDAALPLTLQREKETVAGAYAQYTYNLDTRLTLMAGLRADHSSVYGTFLTPRMHVKWQPNDVFSLRASAGKGYRTAHPLAEMNYLMASGRRLEVSADLKQESAWNYGVSTGLNIPLFGETLKLNAEYYYTHFTAQVMADYDSSPSLIVLGNVAGRSFSHTVQVDASYPLFRGMTLSAAYRRNVVKATLGGVLQEVPLTSRYKGLVSASYKTQLGLWQFDATLQLNGGGRMPSPATAADGTPMWASRFHGYEQLSAQITRWFRHFSVYVGGENLTGRRQRAAIVDAAHPWSSSFDPTMVWGPVSGAMAYAGIRVNLGKRL